MRARRARTVLQIRNCVHSGELIIDCGQNGPGGGQGGHTALHFALSPGNRPLSLERRPPRLADTTIVKQQNDPCVRARLMQDQGAIVLMAGVRVQVRKVQPHALGDARLSGQLIVPIQHPHPPLRLQLPLAAGAEVAFLLAPYVNGGRNAPRPLAVYAVYSCLSVEA